MCGLQKVYQVYDLLPFGRRQGLKKEVCLAVKKFDFQGSQLLIFSQDSIPIDKTAQFKLIKNELADMNTAIQEYIQLFSFLFLGLIEMMRCMPWKSD